MNSNFKGGTKNGGGLSLANIHLRRIIVIICQHGIVSLTFFGIVGVNFLDVISVCGGRGIQTIHEKAIKGFYL